ncbi:hypothetical protein S245_043536 [Arachis hypogaea]|nr:uncharacterized protein DS421_13g405150 [Arachis hypogaea]
MHVENQNMMESDESKEGELQLVQVESQKGVGNSKKVSKSGTSKNNSLQKKGPIPKMGGAKNEKINQPKQKNYGKQVVVPIENSKIPSSPKAKCKDPDVEAMELVTLDSMRRISKEQWEAFLLSKESQQGMQK